MIVMPGSNTGIFVGYLAGRYPGRIGNLFGPADKKGPYDFCPFALDNAAYGASVSGREWSESEWLALLQRVRIRGLNPLWALVPDVVSDRDGTLERWERYLPVVRRFGFRPAFAVQDGMTPSDVPSEATVVFVGGSTEFKWGTLQTWTTHFPRVHVGRVNSYRRLWQCHDAGAESCDGTGWFRGDQGSVRKIPALRAYLEEASGERGRPDQMQLVAGYLHDDAA